MATFLRVFAKKVTAEICPVQPFVTRHILLPQFVFYAMIIITGPLDELKTILGDAVTLVLETIETHIQCFFVQVLQLDLKTLRFEAL